MIDALKEQREEEEEEKGEEEEEKGEKEEKVALHSVLQTEEEREKPPKGIGKINQNYKPT